LELTGLAAPPEIGPPTPRDVAVDLDPQQASEGEDVARDEDLAL
jgi:hypothetical protein